VLRDPQSWNSSAAQNETVTHTCVRCGASTIQEGACPFCDAPLSLATTQDSAPTGIPQRTEGNLAVAVDWRNEVSHRLEAYRVRRRRLCADPAQSDLPFDEPARPVQEKAIASDASRRLRPLPTPAVEPRRNRPRVAPVEIDLAQPVLDFAAAASRRTTKQATALIVPVASLVERRRAALLDVALLLSAYGGFLAMFSAVGGHWNLSKLDFAVTLATLALFYAQYFALFMFCGGATPGMRLRGLRVVTFDGADPSLGHLLWRGVGYLVSGGTLMLGFFWALWDDDHLSWHDRISQTCLTPANTGTGK
jgi:uncharacterized RDD family membrane protein YckC